MTIRRDVVELLTILYFDEHIASHSIRERPRLFGLTLSNERTMASPKACQHMDDVTTIYD